MKEMNLKQIFIRYLKLSDTYILWYDIQDCKMMEEYSKRLNNLFNILTRNLSLLTPSENWKIQSLKELL